MTPPHLRGTTAGATGLSGAGLRRHGHHWNDVHGRRGKAANAGLLQADRRALGRVQAAPEEGGGPRAAGQEGKGRQEPVKRVRGRGRSAGTAPAASQRLQRSRREEAVPDRQERIPEPARSDAGAGSPGVAE